MAGEKEIRTKIKSIKSTQKITRAMEMVAASKMRKAQDRMRSARPYAEKIRQVIDHLAHARPEYRHSFFEEREPKRVGYLVITSDRGLCGGLNVNLFRRMLAEVGKWEALETKLEYCTFGTKGIAFFKRMGGRVVAEASHLGDTPHIQQLIGTVKVMLDAYHEERLDHVYMVYNRFVNSMTQEPTVERLLPLVSSGQKELSHHWDYIYEPGSKEVLDGLLMRYIESLVYQGVVENIASEMAARMVAMKSATDNAGELIDELQLAYNKARQAAITQEISEIVGGAAAV